MKAENPGQQPNPSKRKISAAVSEWCQRHILWTNTASSAFVALVAIGFWLFAGGRTTFGPLNAYILVWTAIWIASVAALNQVLSSIIARQSFEASVNALELTRSTMRPLLVPASETGEPTVIGEAKSPRVLLTVTNSGDLPADDAHVSCFLCASQDNENEKELAHASNDRAYAPSIYFPGADVSHEFMMSPDDFRRCQMGPFKIRTCVTYLNRLAMKMCATDRLFHYDRLSTSRSYPLYTNRSEDSWD